MWRRFSWLGSIALVGIAPAIVRAQTVRGNVVDAASGLPIAEVAVSLIEDVAGAVAATTTRTDSVGAFVLHAPRTGRWRVRATRIGLDPTTSEVITLGPGALVAVRLRMSAVAQRLAGVEVVERRRLDPRELMSTMGFDLRESRGLGRRLSATDLARFGKDPVSEILSMQFQPVLSIAVDSNGMQRLVIRDGTLTCSPELYVDGMEKRGEDFDLTTAASMSADQIYGIEVYRGGEIPPPSLGGFFGTTPPGRLRPCGTVAIWTKEGSRTLMSGGTSRSLAATVQAITGTILDYDTGDPIPHGELTLLSGLRDRILGPVVADARGEFTLRTSRYGELRLQAVVKDYLVSTSPPFRVAADELLVVKVFVSRRNGVLAPLAVAARVGTADIGVGSRAGFTYRRTRSSGGEFIDRAALSGSTAPTVLELLRRMDGIIVRPSADGRIGLLTRSGNRGQECAAVLYVDGTLAADADRLEKLKPADLFGIEVYAAERDVPPLFKQPLGCGAIVVWSN